MATPRDNERGASMVEYALLVALIALAAIVAVQVFGQSLSGRFDSIAQSVQTSN